MQCYHVAMRCNMLCYTHSIAALLCRGPRCCLNVCERARGRKLACLRQPSFTHVPVLVNDGGFGAAQCCYGRKSFADPPTVPWHRSCTQKCAHPRTGHRLVADPAPGMQLHLTHSGSAGCLAPLICTVKLRRPHWTKRTQSGTPRRRSRDEPAPM
jgi:hypothetical protein